MEGAKNFFKKTGAAINDGSKATKYSVQIANLEGNMKEAKRQFGLDLYASLDGDGGWNPVVGKAEYEKVRIIVEETQGKLDELRDKKEHLTFGKDVGSTTDQTSEENDTVTG